MFRVDTIEADREWCILQFCIYFSFRLAYVDPTFRDLHIRMYDTHNRTHVIKIKLPVIGIEGEPTCTSYLPKQFNLRWNSKVSLQIYNHTLC